MSEVQKKLQELSESYQKLQGGMSYQQNLCWQNVLTFCTELSSAVEGRQKLESQQQENATVKKVSHEFDLRPLSDDRLTMLI